MSSRKRKLDESGDSTRKIKKTKRSSRNSVTENIDGSNLEGTKVSKTVQNSSVNSMHINGKTESTENVTKSTSKKFVKKLNSVAEKRKKQSKLKKQQKKTAKEICSVSTRTKLNSFFDKLLQSKKTSTFSAKDNQGMEPDGHADEGGKVKDSVVTTILPENNGLPSIKEKITHKGTPMRFQNGELFFDYCIYRRKLKAEAC